MRKITTVLVLFFVFVNMAKAQSPAKASKTVSRRSFYFSAGTHRAFYSPSDIHLISNAHPSFDFVLHHAKADDDGGLKFNNGAPQYSYNFGYRTKNNWGVEFAFDHVKYIMRNSQTLHVTGTINQRNYDVDTVVGPDFVQFEHTDGANYAMLNFVKYRELASGKKSSLELTLKAGGGVVVPKTNSTIMNKHFDDEYAISGFVVGLEPGLRYNFLRFLFATTSVKAAYADYTHFLIADGHGNQHWFSVQFNLLVGVQVPL
jgi:hypothetical protein